jgi:hypothetical protein
VAWLLDESPPEYRGLSVLRTHPEVLALFAVRHAEGALAAARTTAAGVRADLRDVVAPEVVAAAVGAADQEVLRTERVLRAACLVEESLNGRRWSPRL